MKEELEELDLEKQLLKEQQSVAELQLKVNLTEMQLDEKKAQVEEWRNIPFSALSIAAGYQLGILQPRGDWLPRLAERREAA